MESGIEVRANELIDAFVDRGRCELMHEIATPPTLGTIVGLLGMDIVDAPLFLQ